MANTSKEPSTTQQTPRPTEGGERRVGSPITNEAYNVITALQAKLEGLEAYRKYAKDGDQEVWERLTQSDVETVGVLVEELERMVREGRFRIH